MPTIYTIGYDHLRVPAALVKVLDHLKAAALIDCRSKPYSRIPGFDKASLRRLLGERYEWRPQLGGMGEGARPEAIAALAVEPRVVMLLCKEEAPAACHRHSQIALPLLRIHGVDCIHVYQDELVMASELQRAIDADDDYAYSDAPWAVPAAPSSGLLPFDPPPRKA